jgi:hypothetical protein
MNGDFKGDFTRDTFHLFKGFSRVLMQQGRVQLDADWNEQADILLYLLRRLAKDVIGAQGTPKKDIPAFKIFIDAKHQLDDFLIATGDYYVDGILIENEGSGIDANGEPIPWSYKNQPFQPQVEDLENQAFFLVYLDVWERQVSFIEDDSIREVALGVTGPDTATRAQVVWQVKALTQGDFPSSDFGPQGLFNGLSVKDSSGKLTRFVLISDLKDDNPNKIDLNSLHDSQKDPLRLGNPGRLRARAQVKAQETDPCTIPPDAQFRGAENQLYRVEIHNGGPAWSNTPVGSKSTRKGQRASTASSTGGATFKWSRENGSVVFPIVAIGDKTVTLANLGRDNRSTLKEGDWVELVDDDTVFQVLGNPNSRPYHDNPLLQVQSIDKTTMEVTLNDKPQVDLTKHPLLRRWDQKDRGAKKDGTSDPFDKVSGTMKVIEGDDGEIVDGKVSEMGWITLEDGVQIQFEQSNGSAFYRPGDYWLIPARVITGDVEWPKEKKDGPHKFLHPHGVKHHLAALALVNSDVTPVDVSFQSLVELSHPKMKDA